MVAVPAEQQNEQELLALARALRRSRGEFALFFARCNLGQVQERLIDTLQGILEPFAIQPCILRFTEDGELSTLPEQLAVAAEAGQPVFLAGLENVIPSSDPWPGLTVLNHRRESFHAVHAPVVLWVPEYLLRQIASHAGDFWAWRSGVYQFESDRPTVERVLDEGTRGTASEVASLSAAEKRRRIRLLRALLEDYPDTEPTLQAIRGEVLLQLALLHFTLGEIEAGIAYSTQAEQIAGRISHRALRAAALGNLGFALLNLGRVQDAVSHLQEASNIWAELGDRSREGATLNHLGSAYRALGDFDAARRYHEQAFAIADGLSDHDGQGEALGSLGALEIQTGNPARARVHLEQALLIAREAHDRNSEAVRLLNLMLALSHLGEWDAAIRKGEEALSLAQDLGIRRVELNSLGNLGNAHLARGDHQRAVQCLEQALNVANEVGDRYHGVQVLGNLANAHLAANHREQAMAYYRRALTAARELGMTGMQAGILWNLVGLFDQTGEHRAALAASRLISDLREAGLDGSGPRLPHEGTPLPPGIDYDPAASVEDLHGNEQEIVDTALATLGGGAPRS